MSAPIETPAALLAELSARGVLLHADGDRLRYDAPRGAIGDLLPDLARFKPALLEILATPDDATARACVMPELRRLLPDADVVEIGHLILRLDRGEPIE